MAPMAVQRPAGGPLACADARRTGGKVPGGTVRRGWRSLVGFLTPAAAGADVAAAGEVRA
ncbi:hypothetical protein GCM10020295_13000 [Streptomyces cinereospinus]